MIEDLEIIHRVCLEIRYGDPAYKHDLPFDPGAYSSCHDFELKLMLSFETPAAHKFSVTHYWTALNKQEFELISFGVTSTFGFISSRPFMNRSEIPKTVLLEFVHAAISHSRALLAKSTSERGLMDWLAIDFVDNKLIDPLINEVINQVTI